MQNLKLERDPSTANGTFGELSDENGNFICNTVELPWNDNHPDTSCIPIGSYNFITYFSPKHGFDVWLAQNVPDRADIEIHPANWSSQLLGCIGVGDSIGVISGIPAVLNSQDTFRRLKEALPEAFIITII